MPLIFIEASRTYKAHVSMSLSHLRLDFLSSVNLNVQISVRFFLPEERDQYMLTKEQRKKERVWVCFQTVHDVYVI